MSGHHEKLTRYTRAAIHGTKMDPGMSTAIAAKSLGTESMGRLVETWSRGEAVQTWQ